MEFLRIGVKLFAADPAAVRMEDFIPVFHTWIQEQSIPGHLLIDVHDYSHVHHGPGMLLVGYEGNFSIDESDGRPGLSYFRKIPTGLPPVEHLVAAFQSTLHASRLLEKDGHIRFRTDEFLVIANDRLNTPNNEETFVQLEPDLSAALQQTFENVRFQLERISLDPNERLTVLCRRQ
jgi:hypothetical protein